MPDIIRFMAPILSVAGITDMRIRSVTVDLADPLVKVILQEVDGVGAFVSQGRQQSIVMTGLQASAVIASEAYADVISALPQQLVTGGQLPEQAAVVSV